MTQRGWDIFDVGGIWEIERDDEAAIYEDDEAAIQAACAAARQGDRYAIEAVIAVAFQGQDGWPAFLKEWSATLGGIRDSETLDDGT